MEWLQTILYNSSIPLLTAFLAGLMTAISPCPLATNIAAVGYLGRDVEHKQQVLINGLLYTLGRMASYTLLCLVILAILRGGSSAFGIQRVLGKWSHVLIGPLLIGSGIFMLVGNKLKLKGFGFSGNGERVARRDGWGTLALGALFAMAFCPTSAVLYFGLLIPMAASVTGGWLLAVVFAIATALPVVVVAFVMAYSASSIGRVYGRISTIQKWVNIVVGSLFIIIGITYVLQIII